MQHPSDEDLERYVGRALAASEATAVERHLDACVDCRELVSALMADAPGVPNAQLASAPEEPTLVGHEKLTLKPGDLIEGKYRLRRVVGRGSMGVIYEAHHETLNQRVALKFLDGAFASHPAVQRRFIREARAAARLHGRNVCRVLELGAHAGHHFLVLELLVGQSLEARLQAGPVSWRRAVRWIRGACAGLEEAHALGVVHRDIKPANIFLADVAGTEVVKVLDFGLARSLNPDIDAGLGQLTSKNLFLGTPAYMAPEQYERGPEGAGATADQWSLGVVLYELLAGRRPFDGSDTVELGRAIRKQQPPALRELVPQLPRRVVDVVERCLRKDPTERFPSAAALGQALEELEALRDERHVGRGAAMALGAAAVLVVAGGVVAWRGRSAPDPVPPTAARAATALEPDALQPASARAEPLPPPTAAPAVPPAAPPRAEEATPAPVPTVERPAAVADAPRTTPSKPKARPSRAATRPADPPPHSELELRP